VGVVVVVSTHTPATVVVVVMALWGVSMLPSLFLRCLLARLRSWVCCLFLPRSLAGVVVVGVLGVIVVAVVVVVVVVVAVFGVVAVVVASVSCDGEARPPPLESLMLLPFFFFFRAV